MRRLAKVLALAGFTLGLALPVAPAAAQIDQTCELTLARLEPNVSNTLLLDTNAVYWLVSYQAAPGTRIRITADFPHARYTSWNLYDAGARPADALTDVHIRPDPGSANPFLPGADRTVRKRSYTAFVEFAQKPETPRPNTLYGGVNSSGSPNLTGTLWLRIYVPDRGVGIEGGVPLPKVQVEPAGGGGGSLPFADQCAAYHAPDPPQLQEAFRDSNGVPLPDQTSVGYPGRNPPNWHLYANVSLAFTEVMTDNARLEQFHEGAQQLPTNNPSNPGIFANKDISYVYTATSQGFGEILVVRAKAPTFDATYAPAARMPTGNQVRYFSMCQYEPATQRVIDCARDERTTIRNGYFTYVISHPEDRPANARRECGITWIPQGPQPYGLLIYRHLLPDPSFANSTAQIKTPGREQEVMADYYPRGEYLADKAAFEKRGCPKAASKRTASKRKRATRNRKRASVRRAPRFTG